MRILALVVVIAGCSPAIDPRAPGQPCDAGDSSVCASSATKVICNEGKWLEYPCDGVLDVDGGAPVVGLCRDANMAACLQPKVTAGDWCPSALDGQRGRCLSANTVAVCRAGAWRSCACESNGCREGVRQPGDGSLVVTCAFDAGC